MSERCPNVKARVHVKQRSTRGPQTRVQKLNAKLNNWFENVESFRDFMANLEKELPKPVVKERHVRVAIIDDGVDIFSLSDNVRECLVGLQSFALSEKPNGGMFKAAINSEHGHGTIMACLVNMVCPQAKLYSARLGSPAKDGEFQITVESAVQAIRWAIAMEVHIISMSWTIPHQERPDPEGKPNIFTELEAAIKDAHRKGILMFCSSRDQEYESMHELEQLYPQKCKDAVICIDAAQDSGQRDQWACSDGQFFFPGNASRSRTIQDMQRKSKDTTNLEGSSVATAVAAGFAALILHCAEILLVKQPKVPDDKKLQNVEEHPEADAIRQALRKSENTARIFELGNRSGDNLSFVSFSKIFP
ncbi:Similar to Major intracellular serine protease; acc. no. P11018 [Pyronema omphalodes CBS 100304]|uniref:Similar to Major intracellular serine protease acc. no. P11018 n=1 Tax=Pyronema omphalodes (strain CBS 100304) TaxID=1076935 RepID=U4LKN0_PYROM|nr:Similar to Major intracellular serine protease; acc. no. P11018 [Pyronema omphalodes CBS 100304]